MSAETRAFRENGELAGDERQRPYPANFDRGFSRALRSIQGGSDRSAPAGITADEVADAVTLVQSAARQLKEADEERIAREKHVHSVVTHITKELETAKKRLAEADLRANGEAARAEAAEARAEESEKAFRQLLASINAEFSAVVGT